MCHWGWGFRQVRRTQRTDLPALLASSSTHPRSFVCHRGVCLQGQPSGVPAGPEASWAGILLQPQPQPRGAALLQGPGFLRLSGGPRHGVSRLQEGKAPRVPSGWEQSPPRTPAYDFLSSIGVVDIRSRLTLCAVLGSQGTSGSGEPVEPVWPGRQTGLSSNLYSATLQVASGTTEHFLFLFFQI